jgi:hypothetical protein
MNEKMVLVGIIMAGIFAGLIGHGIGFQQGFEKGDHKFTTDSVILGLLYSEENYYIINQYYLGKIFRINATNQTEALCELRSQISPCLDCKER